MTTDLTNTRDALWYKDAIIYELHIKAFADGNADGFGDFKGLIERLDYLQELGVTAIWLLPFYPSPQRDGGYDISDYYSINPRYGSLEEFQALLDMAHERGLKVITELVINHTSDQHPWFQRARKAPPGSKERNYYVWSDTTDKYKDVRIIFQDFENSNWTWDPVAEAYYWHRFYAHQPDLNYDSPEVQQEIFGIIDFWVDMGVDGFRLDAIPYLFERDGTNCENLPETHAFLKKLRAHVDARKEGVLLLAEANMWPEDSAAYFGDGDECQMNYHFPIMPRMFMAIKMEDRYPIIDIIDQTPRIPDNCQWGIFLRNHDELTLEMVTDEERDYMYRAYNKDALSRINLGIRHRLAPLLDNNRQKIELMNCLLFSLPGTPVLYYGDEIGMGDNVHLGDRDGVRTPMQWNLDRNAGFSKAHPHSLYLPLINDPEYHHATVNVEVQQDNPSSLLWWTKRIINIRKRYRAFGRGDIHFLSPENSKVLAFTRSYQDEHLLVVANLSRHSQVVDLELPEFEQYMPVEVFGQTRFPALERGLNRFTLGPFGYYWFALEPESEQRLDEDAIPELDWVPEDWMQLAVGKGADLLARKVLPAFLARSPGYNLHGRKLDHLEIQHAQPVLYEGGRALLLLLKLFFTEGFPDQAFLPIAMRKGDPRQQPNAPASSQILARLSGVSQHGYLFEADASPAFRNYLLRNLLSDAGRAPLHYSFIRSGGFAWERFEDIPPARVVETSGDNINLAYGNQYFLKIFRHIEDSMNPELEINRHGSGNGLPVPGYLSHLQFDRSNGAPFILAMLQPYHENQGSAWQYFYDVSRRFLERVQSNPAQCIIPEQLPEPGTPLGLAWEELIGGMPLHRAQLLGETVARLHAGLIDESNPDFRPEPFSLHYQRSLYSAWQSQVRFTFQQLGKNREKLPAAERLLGQRPAIQSRLQRIYSRKMDALKVRIHGDLQLEKVLFTGKDFILYDFEGDRTRSFSELRLRKPPMSDLSSLISSLHYAALAALEVEAEPGKIGESPWLPWMEAWFDGISAAFLNGYLPGARKAGLIPPSKEDWDILKDTFLLERRLYELSYELDRHRNWEEIPLIGLLRMMGEGAKE
ncbi:MAG: maltose alpha-D-glucosyltransferase [Phaeodactylibacter sp.]|nr:maltose alpha-D-glucosyltransferase [Phaeodactylibacter sp.]